MTELLLPLCLAYLLGSVSFAYIAGRMRGVDLGSEGSGTLGARNVRRIVGGPAAAAVLTLDLSKGAAAVLLSGAVSAHPMAPMAAWLGVVCGHGYSLFLNFRGGKGLASSAGALALISIPVLIAEFLIGAAVFISGRNLYLASAAMAAALPLTMLVLEGASGSVASLPVAAVILSLHRKNIREISSSLRGDR